MAKRHKERRAHLKRYASDYINVSQRPRHLLLDRKDSEGDHWINFKGRVASVKGPPDGKEPIFGNTYTQDPEWNKAYFNQGEEEEVAEFMRGYPQGRTTLKTYKDKRKNKYEVRYPVYRRVGGPKASSKAVAKVEKELPRNIAQEKSKKRRELSLKSLWTSFTKQGVNEFFFNTMFDTGTRSMRMYFSGNQYFFVERTGNIAKRSVVYSGREQALFYFNSNAINWIETIDVVE